MNEVLTTVNGAIENIDILVTSRIKQKASNPESFKSSWKDDAFVQKYTSDIKQQSLTLSNSCIKLTLLSVKGVDSTILDSLFGEINIQCGTIVSLYILMTEQSIAECFFDGLTKGIRALLGYMKELLEAITNKQFDTLNVIAGMISKITEDEIQKLPLTNKIAYRRYMLEKCVIIKDTIKEFGEYVNVAKQSVEKELTERINSIDINKNNSAENIKNEDEDDDEEEFEEDAEYNATEIPVVERSLALMNVSLAVVKSTFATMTTINDKIVNSNNTNNNNNDSANDNNQSIISAQEWTVKLSNLVKATSDFVTDLGAELYPPIETNALQWISQYYTLLYFNVNDLYTTLTKEEFKIYWSEEITKQMNELDTSIKNIPSSL